MELVEWVVRLFILCDSFTCVLKPDNCLSVQTVQGDSKWYFSSLLLLDFSAQLCRNEPPNYTVPVLWGCNMEAVKNPNKSPQNAWRCCLPHMGCHSKLFWTSFSARPAQQQTYRLLLSSFSSPFSLVIMTSSGRCNLQPISMMISMVTEATNGPPCPLSECSGIWRGEMGLCCGFGHKLKNLRKIL